MYTPAEFKKANDHGNSKINNEGGVGVGRFFSN